MADDARLLRLAAGDNVCVARVALPAGDAVVIDGHQIELAEEIGAGHKLAVRDIAAGEQVLRYGTPIGSATRPIARGAWVHVHNVQSDYLPTFERGGAT